MGVSAGGEEGDVAAERVRKDAHGSVQPIDESEQVDDVLGGSVLAADCPLRVTVAAQVGRDDVVGIAERFRDAVPAAGVVTPAMEAEHDRMRRVAPGPVGQAETLRLVEVLLRLAPAHAVRIAPLSLSASISGQS